MELTVLGCSGSYGAHAGRRVQRVPPARRATPRSGWTAATARFPNLQQHIDPAELSAVVITPRAPRPLRRHLRPARAAPLRARAGSASRCSRRTGAEKRLGALVGQLGRHLRLERGRRRRQGARRLGRPALLPHRPPAADARGRGLGGGQAARSTPPTPARSGASTRSAPARTSCSPRRRTCTTTSRSPSTSRPTKPAWRPARPGPSGSCSPTSGPRSTRRPRSRKDPRRSASAVTLAVPHLITEI